MSGFLSEALAVLALQAQKAKALAKAGGSGAAPELSRRPSAARLHDLFVAGAAPDRRAKSRYRVEPYGRGRLAWLARDRRTGRERTGRTPFEALYRLRLALGDVR